MGANRGSGFKNSQIYVSFLLGTPYKGKIVPISQVGSGFTDLNFIEIAEIVEQNDLRLKKEEVPE